MKAIYLDYAAATPVDSRVMQAMRPYFAEQFHNPSAIYLAGRSARKAMDEARMNVARYLGARPHEIIFTAGATEANNLAIHGVIRRYPKAEMLAGAIEHKSVLSPASFYDHRLLKVNKAGLVDPELLKKMIGPKTVLVSVGLVNNEIGTIQPIARLSQVVGEVRKNRERSGNKLPIWLHTDAAQAPSYLDLHVARLGADMMSLNGGKIYGPKQSGILYVRSGVELHSLISGGGQERGLRAGTESPPAAVGFAKALEFAQAGRVAGLKRITELKDLFIKELTGKIPDAIINSPSKNHCPHIVNVSFPGQDNERLAMELDECGIQVSTGSACSVSSEEPSHVLMAIGASKADAQSSLRFSFGRSTTRPDILKTVKTLVQTIKA